MSWCGKRLHRSFKPHRLLECGARLGRVGAQRRELIRIERQLPYRHAEAMNGRIEARAQQRPNQKLRLLSRHLARVRPGWMAAPMPSSDSASRLHCDEIHSTYGAICATAARRNSLSGPNMLKTVAA